MQNFTTQKCIYLYIMVALRSTKYHRWWYEMGISLNLCNLFFLEFSVLSPLPSQIHIHVVLSYCLADKKCMYSLLSCRERRAAVWLQWITKRWTKQTIRMCSGGGDVIIYALMMSHLVLCRIWRNRLLLVAKTSSTTINSA